MEKGFDRVGFMEYLENEFSGFDNQFLRETVDNIVNYGLEHKHVSLDQFCYWLSDMLPEVEFKEVAFFMEDAYLTEHGKEEKREREKEKEVEAGLAEHPWLDDLIKDAFQSKCSVQQGSEDKKQDMLKNNLEKVDGPDYR